MNADTFAVSGLDHLVLCVQDVGRTRDFYERVLGMESREERPGKWSVRAKRAGATGPILSVYVHDPDGNLVEISNPLG